MQRFELPFFPGLRHSAPRARGILPRRGARKMFPRVGPGCKLPRMRNTTLSCTAAALFCAAAPPATLLSCRPPQRAARVATEYQITPNVTLPDGEQPRIEARRLRTRRATTPQPTVVYFHGGFWQQARRKTPLLALVPRLEMGWNVVNVEYRLARGAGAAAVEDALCALRFLPRKRRPIASTCSASSSPANPPAAI